MHVMKTAEACVLVVTMDTSLSLAASYNLETKTFSLITDHELDMLLDAIDDKVHVCDECVQVHLL